MSYRWTRARLETDCGAELGYRIAVGEALCEQWVRCAPDAPGMKPLIRCARHAHLPMPEDLPALDPVDAALDLTPTQIRPVVRDLPFDAKMAAAGEREDA